MKSLAFRAKVNAKDQVLLSLFMLRNSGNLKDLRRVSRCALYSWKDVLVVPLGPGSQPGSREAFWRCCAWWPARLVSNGLSASGLEAKRRFFCSHQETCPEIQRDVRYGQVNFFMWDQLTHIDHSLATRSCLSQVAVGWAGVCERAPSKWGNIAPCTQVT